MAILRTLNETMQEIRTSPQPRIAVETMLIGLCRPSEGGRTENAAVSSSNPADTARIARLEEEVRRLAARLAAGAAPASSASAGKASAVASPEQSSAPPAKAAPVKTPSARQTGAGVSTEGAPRQLDGALWKKFQARLKERHKLAASLLSGADYEGATETHFFIRPATDMARDYITKRHRGVFEEVMTELAGRPLAVVCTGGEEDAVPPPSAAKTPEYPAPVAELLKIAGEGARVEEVTPSVKPPVQRKAPPPVSEMEPYEVYEPTVDEEAEMFMDDELPPDENT